MSGIIRLPGASPNAGPEISERACKLSFPCSEKLNGLVSRGSELHRIVRDDSACSEQPSGVTIVLSTIQEAHLILLLVFIFMGFYF